jgi:hypothetical protein
LGRLLAAAGRAEKAGLEANSGFLPRIYGTYKGRNPRRHLGFRADESDFGGGIAHASVVCRAILPK